MAKRKIHIGELVIANKDLSIVYRVDDIEFNNGKDEYYCWPLIDDESSASDYEQTFYYHQLTLINYKADLIECDKLTRV